MYPPTHFLTGLFLGELGVSINYFNHYEALFLAVLCLLIDLDHYIYYSIKHKTLSLVNAWQAAIKGREKKERTAIHHSVGFALFTLCFVIIWFYNQKWAWLLGMAYYSHIILDYLPLPKNKHCSFKVWKLTFKLTAIEIILNLLLGIAILVLIFI